MATTAPPIPNRLQMQVAEGIFLRVDFDRAVDRWKHRVSLVLPERCGVVSPVLLLESVEGNSEEDWPASPPLQFVSIESRPTKPPVALLMGMAGTSHWSASIEQDLAGRALRFDIACCAKSRPERLGSIYRIAPRVQWQSAGDESALFRFTAGERMFELRGDCSADAPLPVLNTVDQQLQIQYGQPASQPQTYRWVYSLTYVD
jgi:hypothetical protein